MHVNPAVIGANSSRYNAHSPAQQAKQAAQQKDVSAAKTASVDAAQVKQAAKEEEFSFWDLVDIVNPLQHIPIVSTIYREITGDRINGFGRIAGGAIFGGFAGAALGGLNALVKSDTGNDLGEMAMVKAGFRPDKPQDEPIHMVPVTAKDAAKETMNERATLDTIIWDAPSLLQVATKESITWDAPSVAIVEQPARSIDVAQKNNAAKTVEKSAQEIPAHVVRDVQPDAYKMAAAFDPASLNDIEPGNPASPLPQNAESSAKVEHANVPQNMMQALSKYQSMQRLGGENAVAAQELKLAERRGDTTQKFAKLEGKIRRY